jgi:hypothetical protein
VEQPALVFERLGLTAQVPLEGARALGNVTDDAVEAGGVEVALPQDVRGAETLRFELELPSAVAGTQHHGRAAAARDGLLEKVEPAARAELAVHQTHVVRRRAGERLEPPFVAGLPHEPVPLWKLVQQRGEDLEHELRAVDRADAGSSRHDPTIVPGHRGRPSRRPVVDYRVNFD